MNDLNAIPVEWLRKVAKQQEDSGEWEDAAVINWLIWIWREETSKK